ncbi:hypothetical protein AN958_00117 [Leucoagaricus sp. SymC.cos]|nr:hypothetical protein AN958_00117 [Leucoagaricus sp. SymC.cos]
MSNQEVSVNNHHHSQEGSLAVIEPRETRENQLLIPKSQSPKIKSPASSRGQASGRSTHVSQTTAKQRRIVSSPPHDDEKKTARIPKFLLSLRRRLQHRNRAFDSGRPESSRLERSNSEGQSIQAQV